MLIQIDAIAAFNWNTELGAKLRAAREEKGLSRRQLSELTRLTSKTVSEQYIQQLESPDLFTGKQKKTSQPTVSMEILESLLTALGGDFSCLFTTAEISLPIPLSSITERSNIEE